MFVAARVAVVCPPLIICKSLNEVINNPFCGCIMVSTDFAVVEIPLLYVKNLDFSFNIVPRIPLLTLPLNFRNERTFDSNKEESCFLYISARKAPPKRSSH
jgi:hypothetical protein